MNIGSCFRDYRNTPAPVFVKIKYANDELSVDMDLRQGGQSYTNCFVAKGLDLPTGYRFGLTAASSKRGPDDHDILTFETYELDPVKQEHKLRPHEQEDIDQGHAFKMNDTYIEV